MAEDRMIRVLVADSDPAVRARFVALLAGLPGVAAPVAVATPDELAERLRTSRVDLVLLAEELDGVDGLELWSSLALRHPDVQLLFAAFDPPVETILLAIEVGAVGVVVRERGPDDVTVGDPDTSATLLQAAIRSARAGGIYVDPRVTEGVVGVALETFGDKSETNGHV